MKTVLKTLALMSVAAAYFAFAAITFLVAAHTPWPNVTVAASLIMAAASIVVFLTAPLIASRV